MKYPRINNIKRESLIQQLFIEYEIYLYALIGYKIIKIYRPWRYLWKIKKH